ncbi:hypothetical protein EDWATA_00058 [Edwardsiella tarda ATCC 23685]|uniref:Uncharacterized protein n=1 Tax=Edwardsiella tarda ATCC 23685 TaxID=500638 RepID=D4F036_EDWTA|nr:hypothetical protein EDWATA_00058 [Edwardsiella tarda ATCC 23685]
MNIIGRFIFQGLMWPLITLFRTGQLLAKARLSGLFRAVIFGPY